MGNCTDIEDTGILVYINAFEKVYRHLKYHFIKSFYVLIEITQYVLYASLTRQASYSTNSHQPLFLKDQKNWKRDT